MFLIARYNNNDYNNKHTRPAINARRRLNYYYRTRRAHEVCSKNKNKNTKREFSHFAGLESAIVERFFFFVLSRLSVYMPPNYDEISPAVFTVDSVRDVFVMSSEPGGCEMSTKAYVRYE